MNLVFTLFFMIVSMGCFVLFALAHQGLVFIIKSLLYPFFAFGVMLVWCMIGQSLINQTEQLDYSLYKCNWTDAPMRFRKILFMFIFNCRRNVEIDAKPFYKVNLFMFTDVSQSSVNLWGSC